MMQRHIAMYILAVALTQGSHSLLGLLIWGVLQGTRALRSWWRPQPPSRPPAHRRTSCATRMRPSSASWCRVEDTATVSVVAGEETTHAWVRLTT